MNQRFLTYGTPLPCSQRVRLVFCSIFWAGLAGCLLVAGAPAAYGAKGPQKSGGQESPLTVQVEWDKTEAQVADPIRLEVTVWAPEKVKVQFPEIGKQLGEFDVVHVDQTLDLPDAKGRKSMLRIRLESLTAGKQEVPPLEIRYTDRRGDHRVTGTERIDVPPVTIRSTLEGSEDPTHFRDIKPVIDVPVLEESHGIGWGWFASIGGGLLFAGIVWWMVKRRSVAKTPQQWALHAIDELVDSRVYREGDGEEVVTRLTQILRQFIERQFGISAPRLTTDEFLDQTKKDARLTDDLRERLQEFLASADVVKFAGRVPDRDGLAAVVEQSRGLIMQAAEEAPTATETPTATEAPSVVERPLSSNTAQKEAV